MSRTVKGSKSPGFDYWSRRPTKGDKNSSCAGYGPEVKRRTHRAERRIAERAVRKLDT